MLIRMWRLFILVLSCGLMMMNWCGSRCWSMWSVFLLVSWLFLCFMSFVRIWVGWLMVGIIWRLRNVCCVYRWWWWVLCLIVLGIWNWCCCCIVFVFWIVVRKCFVVRFWLMRKLLCCLLVIIIWNLYGRSIVSCCWWFDGCLIILVCIGSCICLSWKFFVLCVDWILFVWRSGVSRLVKFVKSCEVVVWWNMFGLMMIWCIVNVRVLWG